MTRRELATGKLSSFKYVTFFDQVLLTLIFSEDNCPWAAIASLALHKLYTDWQSQGYTLPKVIKFHMLMSIKTKGNCKFPGT